MSTFGDRIADWLDEEQVIREGLCREGPELIERVLWTHSISLRELARRVELTPTYLSRVRNGKATLSPESFIRIENEVRDYE